MLQFSGTLYSCSSPFDFEHKISLKCWIKMLMRSGYQGNESFRWISHNIVSSRELLAQRFRLNFSGSLLYKISMFTWYSFVKNNAEIYTLYNIYDVCSYLLYLPKSCSCRAHSFHVERHGFLSDLFFTFYFYKCIILIHILFRLFPSQWKIKLL